MAKKAASRAKSSISDAKSMQSLELFLQALGEQLGDDFEPDNDVDKAQEIMFDAWEARGGKQRIALAHKALAVSPLCADAYVMLAAEAEKTLQEMLRLNPSDNQGVRYELLDQLLESGRDKEAKELVKAYNNDGSAAWAFGRALLQFRTSGDNEKSRQLLKSAVECNPHVAAYLTGAKAMPRKLPAYYGMGDDSEAAVYALTGKAPWAATTGALDWLTSKRKAGQ